MNLTEHDPTIVGQAAPAGDRRQPWSDGGLRRIAIRLNPALHVLLIAKAAESRTSQGQVVLDSVEAAHITCRLLVQQSLRTTGIASHREHDVAAAPRCTRGR